MLMRGKGVIPDRDTVAAQWGETLTAIDKLATVSLLPETESIELTTCIVASFYASTNRRTDTSTRGHSKAAAT